MDEEIRLVKPEYACSPGKAPYAPIDHEYRTLIDSMQVCIGKHLLNEHFTTVWANRYFFEAIEYTQEEYQRLFHNNMDEYFHNDIETFYQLYALARSALKNKRSRFEYPCKMPQNGGSDIRVRLTGMLTGETVAGLPVIYIMFTNMTDMARTQPAQMVPYETIPGLAAEFQIKNEFQFKLIAANNRFLNFFGEKFFCGNTYSIADIENEDNRKALLSHYEYMRKGEPVRFIVQVQDKNENNRQFQVNVGCSGRPNGGSSYFVLFIDVSETAEQHALEQKLKERSDLLRGALDMAERANRAKSDFLSRMSHDIRTPMNAIMGMTAIARGSLNDPARLEDCLDKVESSAKYLLSLIDDILDMSKIENGQMTLKKQKINFVEFIRGIAVEFFPETEKKHLHLRISVDPNVKEFYIGDEPKLRKALVNLLNNAVKFTAPEGDVTLLVTAGKRSGSSSELIFIIRDNGLGMEPAILDKLFQPFEQDTYQREIYGGSGLGLAIAQNYVHSMNGTILVKSEPGQGSEFTVRVWLDSLEKVKTANGFEKRFNGLKILIADSDIKLCQDAAELFRQLDATVQCTQDAAEALLLLEEENARKSPFDLLVIDQKLTQGGLLSQSKEFCQLRRSGLNVAVSGYDRNFCEEAALQNGCYFLQKPLFCSTVYDFLLQVTQGQPSPESKCEIIFHGERILLAEDNDVNLEIAQTLLESRNLTVDAVRDGKEAVAMFQNSAPGTYCAVLMDIQMPVMNGLEATRVIRSLKRCDANTVPIIATSAHAFDEDVEKSLQSGMDAHISKPMDIPMLFKVLYDLINK